MSRVYGLDAVRDTPSETLVAIVYIHPEMPEELYARDEIREWVSNNPVTDAIGFTSCADFEDFWDNELDEDRMFAIDTCFGDEEETDAEDDSA